MPDAVLVADPVPSGVDLEPLLDVVLGRSEPGSAATAAVACLLEASHPCSDARSFDVGPEASLVVLPARLSLVATARRSVLVRYGDAAPVRDRADDVVVAVSEAVANAVEHAHGGADGCALALLVAPVDGSLRVVVGDDGRWDESPPGPYRGRGSGLMAALSDGFARYSDAHGTVVVLSFSPSDPPSPAS